MTHWSDKLSELGACSEAIEYARTQENPEAAWANCERADWMIWAAEQLTDTPREIYMSLALTFSRSMLEDSENTKTADAAAWANAVAWANAANAARTAARMAAWMAVWMAEAKASAARVNADAVRAAIPYSKDLLRLA